MFEPRLEDGDRADCSSKEDDPRGLGKAASQVLGKQPCVVRRTQETDEREGSGRLGRGCCRAGADPSCAATGGLTGNAGTWRPWRSPKTGHVPLSRALYDALCGTNRSGSPAAKQRSGRAGGWDAMEVKPGRQVQSEALLLGVFPRPSGPNFLMDTNSTTWVDSKRILSRRRTHK